MFLIWSQFVISPSDSIYKSGDTRDMSWSNWQGLDVGEGSLDYLVKVRLEIRSITGSESASGLFVGWNYNNNKVNGSFIYQHLRVRPLAVMRRSSRKVDTTTMHECVKILRQRWIWDLLLLWHSIYSFQNLFIVLMFYLKDLLSGLKKN